MSSRSMLASRLRILDYWDSVPGVDDDHGFTSQSESICLTIELFFNSLHKLRLYILSPYKASFISFWSKLYAIHCTFLFEALRMHRVGWMDGCVHGRYICMHVSMKGWTYAFYTSGALAFKGLISREDTEGSLICWGVVSVSVCMHFLGPYEKGI